MSKLKGRENESLLTQPFYSIQALNRVDDNPHWEGQSTLPSPLIQMLAHPETPS